MKKNIKDFFVENNKYVWECDNIRIVFSDPCITGYNSFTPITKDKNDILYYYYTVEIYKYVYVEPEVEPKWDEDLEKYYDWVLFNSIRTHDFPQIEDLLEMIKELIKDDMSEAQVIHLRDKHIKYRKTLYSNDFMYEDYYELTKETSSYSTEPYKPIYSLYIGFEVDGEAGLNTLGAKIDTIYEEELIELKKCVENFINYSIKYHNECVKKRNSLFLESMEVKNDIITCYEMNVVDFTLNKNKISKTLAIGDNIEIYLIESDSEFECDITGTIVSISKDKIVLEKGDIIKLENIAYISKKL